MRGITRAVADEEATMAHVTRVTLVEGGPMRPGSGYAAGLVAAVSGPGPGR
jgi:hypothetical protein